MDIAKLKARHAAMAKSIEAAETKASLKKQLEETRKKLQSLTKKKGK